MTRTRTLCLIAAAAVAMVGPRGTAVGQTRIDLKTQSKSVDFSSAQSTKPIKTGSAIPPTCIAGEAYLLLTGSPGSNIYTCIATNTWVRQGGTSLPAAGNQPGRVLTNTGDATYTWANLTGDLTGGAAAKVTGLQGRPIADVAPADGDVMTWTPADGWRPAASNSNTVTVQLDGITRGAHAIHNFVSGLGLVNSAYDAGSALVFQNSINTAVVQTRANAQSGTDNLVSNTSSDGTTFVGQMTPTLTAYVHGMVVQFRPNQDCAGAATLDIDTLGPKHLYSATGAAAMTCSAGQQVPIWYDSTANGTAGGWRKQVDAGGVADGSKGDVTVSGDVWTVGPLPASRVGLMNVANFGLASQADAEAGSAADKYMTPQRTRQAVTALAPRYVEYPGAKCFSGAAATPLSLPTTGAPNAVCATGVNGNGGVLQFPDDGSTVISAKDAMVLTGTLISLDIWWRANVADASLNAVWQIQTACIAPGQDGDPSWNPAQAVTSSAHVTANRWRKASISSVTATGCSPGNVMRWKLSRNPADAADTLSATADLISILWTLQRGDQ